MASTRVVHLSGAAYAMRDMDLGDVSYGTLVRYANGSVTRRILCTDGDDVILRSVVSPSVLEAVTREALLRDWCKLVHVSG